MKKKALKKQIKLELTAVIKKTLSDHNSGAVKKTKKAIKKASKIVTKKFVKAVKNLSKKKKPTPKASSHKSKPAKSVAKIANTKRGINGRFASTSNGVSKHDKVELGSVKRKATAAMQSVHHN